MNNDRASASESFKFAEHTGEEVLDMLRSAKTGLTQTEAERRLTEYGKNTVNQKRRFVWLRRIFGQLKSPVVSILLISSIVLFIIEYYTDAFVILAALIINLAVALLQEEKVSNAFKLLRDADKLYAHVMRDGRKIRIPAEDLVPGDIVLLETGSKAPADIRLLWESDLEVDESALTGEWAPVKKSKTTLAANRTLAEQVNMVWKGTTVVEGKGRGVVIRTGIHTAVGEIAANLYETHEKTPLQLQIQRLAQLIMILVVVSVLIIVGIALLQNLSFMDVIITAIAVAVAGIPSGLPAAITVVLVVGMQAVLKRHGLMRNLLAAETLGGTTWILTDKTGTLTRGDMTLRNIIFADRQEKASDDSLSPVGRDVVLSTYLATDGKRIKKKDSESEGTELTGTPIEKAIVYACEELCVDTPTREPRIMYKAFSSKNRHSSAFVRKQDGTVRYYIVGSPETVLERSDMVYCNDRTQVLTTALQKNLEKNLMNEAEKGRRVIAVAAADAALFEEQNVTENPKSAPEYNPDSITFLAFLSFEDGIRDDVPEAINRIRKAHVMVNMVTGDNHHTALQIAKESGIVRPGESEETLLGDAVRELSDEALFEKAKTVRVFARMLPDQKSRLLRVLLAQNEVVAMTGDGINDAPALHRASIGIAMSSGTDVAKEASDLILLKNSFSTITASIIEGKRIIRNLKKILIYLLSTSFSEAMLVAGGLLATATLPITPVQILWANIVEEAFIAFAFAFEKEDIDITTGNPRSKENTSIISKSVRRTVVLLVLLTGTFLLAMYYFFTAFTSLTQEQIQTVMFLTVSIDSVFLALSLKHLGKSVFATNPFSNMWLIGAIVISVMILIIAFVTPFFADILTLKSLPLWAFSVIPISALFHITVIETIKIALFKKEYKEKEI